MSEPLPHLGLRLTASYLCPAVLRTQVSWNQILCALNTHSEGSPGRAGSRKSSNLIFKMIDSRLEFASLVWSRRYDAQQIFVEWVIWGKSFDLSASVSSHFCLQAEVKLRVDGSWGSLFSLNVPGKTKSQNPWLLYVFRLGKRGITECSHIYWREHSFFSIHLVELTVFSSDFMYFFHAAF